MTSLASVNTATANSPQSTDHQSNSAHGPVPGWQRIVERLPQRDPDLEWYELPDLAPLLGIKERQLRNYCRKLWPGHDNRAYWRLSYEQAVRLIRLVFWAGKKVPRV